MNSIGLRYTSLVRRIVTRMSSTNTSYEDAIRKLNSLQSNKSTIEQIKKGLKTGQKCTNIEDMERYLRRIGISLARLDHLSVIHVAGTKGKGSTSAMCESILRRHGFRTGFFSSPHLVAARERIRLDGVPMSKQDFAETLHHVYGMLWDTQEYEGDMPKYFAFLTVCALHEFLHRPVDVAVIEVGIGGIVDYTNVLRKVPVVGITALGLDHTSILGSTLAEIAAAKAGVMKRGCDAYTVTQPLEAHDVLCQYADTVKCPLTVVPDYKNYVFASEPHLPVDLDAYKTNASLAIQLAHAWMRYANIANVKTENGVKNDIGIQNGVKNENAHVNFVTNGNVIINKNKNDIINDNIPHSIPSNGKVDNCVANGTVINEKQNGVIKRNVINDTLKYDVRNGMANGKTLTYKLENVMSNHNIANNYKNGVSNSNKLVNGYSEKSTNNVEKFIKNGNVILVKCEKDETNVKNQANGDKNAKNLLNGSKIVNNLANGGTNVKNLDNGDTNVKNLANGHTNVKNLPNGSTNVKNLANHCDKNLANGSINARNLTNSDTNAKNLTNGHILDKLIFQVPLPTVEGLSQCRWPGRYQVIDTEFARFYLDGAHTKESMEICARWFLDNSSAHNKSLIFTATGDRNAATLLQPLTEIPFRQIYFVNPTAHTNTYKNQDNYSLIEQQELEERCRKHAQIWRERSQTTNVYIFDCVSDALEDIKEKGIGQAVLVTGSLHLVGAALSILDPSLSA